MRAAPALPRAARRLPLAAAGRSASADGDDVRIRALLQRLEQVALRGDAAAYLALLAGTADRNGADATSLADEFRPGATRVVIQERDRQDAAPGRCRATAIA